MKFLIFDLARPGDIDAHRKEVFIKLTTLVQPDVTGLVTQQPIARPEEVYTYSIQERYWASDHYADAVKAQAQTEEHALVYLGLKKAIQQFEPDFFLAELRGNTDINQAPVGAVALCWQVAMDYDFPVAALVNPGHTATFQAVNDVLQTMPERGRVFSEVSPAVWTGARPRQRTQDRA